MPTACVHTPGSKIRLESERLIITVPEEGDGPLREIRREILLRDLERMVMSEHVSATMPALAELMRRLIPISFMDKHGRFLGSFQPVAPHHGAARLRHYQRSLETSFCREIAAEIISAKIYNQRRLIQRVAANRKADDRNVPPGIPEAVAFLSRTLDSAVHANPLDSLRGYEGIAAARYFSAWASLLPADASFERRSTRPPLNPVNATLSFCSTLVYQETHAFIHAHGLDAALGILHTTENGRWSLALDLMEPFRPVIAEALTLDLFSHRILNSSHFEPQQAGIYLNRDGRGKLLLQYEKRMERQFMCEAIGHRTTLRQQLENHAILFKAALDDPSRFKAFRMN